MINVYAGTSDMKKWDVTNFLCFCFRVDAVGIYFSAADSNTKWDYQNLCS